MVNETSPDQCTLVPDSEDQLTSDHGWNITEKDHNKILDLISQIPNETRKSFFVDPVESHIEAINKLGSDRIELIRGHMHQIQMLIQLRLTRRHIPMQKN